MAAVAHKLDCLVHGYVSTEIKQLNMEDQYPTALNVFIMNFLGNIWMRFDLFNERFKECVKNDGTLIIKQPDVSGKDFSILSSTAFESGDIGEFKIKCIRNSRK